MRHLTTADVAEIIDHAPVSRLQLHAIAIALLVTMLDGFDTQSIAFVAPSIGREWGVARGDFGLAFSAGVFGAMLGSLLLSPLGDRFGRRPMILVSTIAFALLSLLCAFAHDLTTLVIYRAVAGLGIGAVFPNLVALAFEYAPQRKRALVTGLVSVSIPAGGMLGGVLSTQLIPRFGWPSVFVAGCVLPLLIVPLIISFLPESIRYLALRPARTQELVANLSRIEPMGDYAGGTFSAAPDSRHGRGQMAGLFTEGRAAVTLTLWLITAASLFMMNFMVNWLPSVAHAAGLSITQAILTTTVFNLGQITGAIGFTWAVDRLRSYTVLPIAYLICAAAVASVGFASHTRFGLFTAIFVSGVGLLGGTSGISVITGIVYPTTARATGIGWAYGVGRIGSVIGPIAGGIIVSLNWSVQRTFLFGAVPALIAALGTAGILVSVATLQRNQAGGPVIG